MRMCGDIFAAARLWTGSLLTTGHLSSAILLSWVRGTWRGGRSSGVGRGVGVLRAPHCHLRAGFQQCKSFVEMCPVRYCPLWHPAHCPMGTVPRVLVWRTASPEHADFVGLSSGASPVVVRLDVVPLQPSSSTQTVTGFRLGGYPVGRDWWGGKRDAGGMSKDHDRCFSMLVLGAFSTGVFQTPASSPAQVNHSARAPEPTQVIVCRRPGVQR